MSELKQEIRRLIEADGPMPMSRYMALCADHYYATRDPFGARGDFITAPEVSQMRFLSSMEMKLAAASPRACTHFSAFHV